MWNPWIRHVHFWLNEQRVRQKKSKLDSAHSSALKPSGCPQQVAPCISYWNCSSRHATPNYLDDSPSSKLWSLKVWLNSLQRRESSQSITLKCTSTHNPTENVTGVLWSSNGFIGILGHHISLDSADRPTFQTFSCNLLTTNSISGASSPPFSFHLLISHCGTSKRSQEPQRLPCLSFSWRTRSLLNRTAKFSLQKGLNYSLSVRRRLSMLGTPMALQS